MKPFGCYVTILNTLDRLGKFYGKSDDGFFVGYSLNSNAFRVYNIRTRKIEENLHVRFLEDKPIVAGDGPKWLFDINVLTESMNYVPVVAGTNSNDFVGTQESIGVGQSNKDTGSSQDYILMPLWKDGLLFDSSLKNANNDEPQPSNDAGKKDDKGGIDNQDRPKKSAQDANTVGPSINTASTNKNIGSLNINTGSPIVTTDPTETTHGDCFEDEIEVDMSNISTTYPVPSTPNTRIHKDHSLDNVIGNVQSSVQTKRTIKTTNDQRFISVVYEEKTHKDLHTCLFACFLSQEEPKRIAKALSDSAWVEVMYGYIKNHKKTIKNGQARTRERKSEQKPEVKVNLGQASVKEKVNQGASLNQGSKRTIQELVNKMARIDQSNQRISLAHSQAQATCDEEKAQRDVGFALNALSKQSQLSLKRIAMLAICVSSLVIQRWTRRNQ
ncbi:hypothetical protein Tco_0453728 [Tanacetum coccineum]